VVTMILMFIGGSPGSTAGGVKTTSIALMFITLYSILTGKKDVNCFKRNIPFQTLKQASSVFFIGILIVLLMFMILLAAEPNVPMERLLFEVFSAYSTVGLTCDLTPHLSSISKSALIICMFTGRVGPLTIAYVITRKERKELENKGQFKLPEGNILIG
ncbi:MAG: potassium transporter TrkG, partial [Eubacterium sp.]